MTVDLEAAVRTAIKNHSTASGHENTAALVARVMAEHKGSGGPISPGKRAAKELAAESRHSDSKAGAEAAGKSGGKGAEEPHPKSTGDGEESSTHDRTPAKPAGGGAVKDHGITTTPSEQSSERSVASAPKPPAAKKTSTSVARNSTSLKSTKSEDAEDNPDGSPRISVDALFRSASAKARERVRKARSY